MSEIYLLSWDHPVIGRIEEPVCVAHDAEVRAALFVLGIGSMSTDRTDEIACLRCNAHPANLPRTLLRQWFGGES